MGQKEEIERLRKGIEFIRDYCTGHENHHDCTKIAHWMQDLLRGQKLDGAP